MLSTSLSCQAANLPNPIRKKLKTVWKTGRFDYSRRLSRAETNNGYCLTDDTPVVVREGVGDVKPFYNKLRSMDGRLWQGSFAAFCVDSRAVCIISKLCRKHGDPFYEEGISLFDVEATLQPDGVPTSKKIFIFRREISRLSTAFS